MSEEEQQGEGAANDAAPEPAGKAEAEGVEQVTGASLPADKPGQENPAPGTPAPAERPQRPDRPVREAAAAAPAAPVEPPPGTVWDVFRDVLPGVPIQARMGATDVLLGVRPAEIQQVLTAAKHDARLAFDYLRCISGVDYEAEGIEVVYQLYSFTHKHSVIVKCMLPPDHLSIPSMIGLWKAADWLEREIWEMFGVEFAGHPRLEPLLLEEDTVHLHPLRKSHPITAIEVKQGAGIADGGDGDGE